MTEEKHAEGTITAISDKRNKGKEKGYGVLLGPQEGKNWINFDEVLPEWIQKGLYVFVTYTENKGFKNGKNITKRDPPKGEGKTPETGNEGFQPANSIDSVDRIVGGCADVAARCMEAFKGMTGNYPATDGEWAVVNTLQIEVYKHVSSRMIVDLAMKKAADQEGKK